MIEELIAAGILGLLISGAISLVIKTWEHLTTKSDMRSPAELVAELAKERKK